MTDIAASPLPNSQDAAKPAAKRHWYHSVAGRLLLAFLLITLLTVVGTTISIIRFGNLGAVLHRLIDVSLPAVKSSLGIETNATQVAITAGQLGNVTRTTQLLSIVRVDAERGLLLVKGCVPGADGGDIMVLPSVKTPIKKGA